MLEKNAVSNGFGKKPKTLFQSVPSPQIVWAFVFYQSVIKDCFQLHMGLDRSWNGKPSCPFCCNPTNQQVNTQFRGQSDGWTDATKIF